MQDDVGKIINIHIFIWLKIFIMTSCHFTLGKIACDVFDKGKGYDQSPEVFLSEIVNNNNNKCIRPYKQTIQ